MRFSQCTFEPLLAAVRRLIMSSLNNSLCSPSWLEKISHEGENVDSNALWRSSSDWASYIAERWFCTQDVKSVDF